MTIPLLQFCHSLTTLRRFSASLVVLTIVFNLVVFNATAQTIVWSDSFEQGEQPTRTQCNNWSLFLDQLDGKTFASVTISGSRDETGKTMKDPAAATELARLLATRTPGTVVSGEHVWTVTKCQASACPDERETQSIALSYKGNTEECNCYDRYAIRPQSLNEDWGGIDVDYSCLNSPSQTMRLEFNSGVSIVVNGSTTLCEGASVELIATTEVCEGPLAYAWSNGATTPSITVSEPGSYSVTVSGADGCSGISETVVVSRSDVSVTAGEDLTYCDEPVQLNAVGTSAAGPGLSGEVVCLYSSQGDCVFLGDVCAEEAEFIGNSHYSGTKSFSNPTELRYHIYYSPFAKAVFRFRLNGHEIGSFDELNPTGLCEDAKSGKFPRTFAFTETEFKAHWIEDGENELSVDIEAPDRGIYLAGITVEVLTAEEKYVWTPTEGLTLSTVRNPLAAPAVTTTYTVTYKDANDCVATDEVTVTVHCEDEAPVAVCKPIVVELEEGCEAIVEASAFDGGSTSSSGSPLQFSVSPEGPYPVGVTEVTLTVMDASGHTSSCETTITVTDPIAPVLPTLEDITVVAGGDDCSAIVELPVPEASDNCAIASITHDRENNVFPAGETIVTWTAQDIHGNLATTTQKVVVTNFAPVIVSVTASASAVSAGKPITLTTHFTDDNAASATIDWGDDSPPQTINNPSEVFEAVHAYREIGFYDITVTVRDHCDALASGAHAVAVYDGGGSVRGDGWFNSERGYYLKNPRAAGKAQFHFDANYKHGSSVPKGSISFKFKDGKLEFKSTALHWLMVEDDHATLYGTGKVNGEKNYSILVAAVDEDWKGHPHDKKQGKDKDKRAGKHEDKDKKHGKPDDKKHGDDKKDDKKKDDKKGKKKDDRIRVKIWDPAGKVIYDTQAGDDDGALAANEIGGGSIEIKQSKVDEFKEKLEDIISHHFGEEAPSVYPNPFTDWLKVQYNRGGHEPVVIQLLDLTGHVVVSQTFPVSDDGHYWLDIPRHVRAGIYVLVIKQGRRVEYLRLLRK